jgi:hypothetical protein
MQTSGKASISSAIRSGKFALSSGIIPSIVFYIALLYTEGFGGSKNAEIISESLYFLIIAICCFFIVKKNPSSVLYTPILSNAMPFYFLAVISNYWNDPSTWIPIGGFVLSIIASIIGARAGKRNAIKYL